MEVREAAMDKFDRIQLLHRILRGHRYPVSKRVLADRLECTPRNVGRIIDQMQLYLDAPIEYDPGQKGWQYTDDPAERFELPGLWLTAAELQSLSLLLNLLQNLGNGLLNEEIRVIEREVTKLLRARDISPNAFTRHIKVLPVAYRQLPGAIFHKVTEALLHQRRARIQYTSYDRRKTTRDISPQTLIHYRENWYLDAWCHLRQGLRTFSIARIDHAHILDSAAQRVDEEELEAWFAGSYGIFAGAPRETARLLFDSQIAHEIALQQWHPQQKGEWIGEAYRLDVPYARSDELIQDILRHTPHVRVEGPESLKQAVRDRLLTGAKLYE